MEERKNMIIQYKITVVGKTKTISFVGDYSYDDKFLKIYPPQDNHLIVIPLNNIEMFEVVENSTMCSDMEKETMSEQERRLKGL